MNVYQRWIADNVEEPTLGQCGKYSDMMVKVFPELRRVDGRYHCTQVGSKPHAWCVTLTGEIVDPTATQFPSNGAGRYEIIKISS